MCSRRAHIRVFCQRAQEHRLFLKGVRAYIAELNANPAGSQGMLRQAVRQAVQEVDEERKKGSRQLQRRTFVTEVAYNQRYADQPHLNDLFSEKEPVIARTVI